MTPRKETEPTKEYREEARKLCESIFAPITETPIIALWLARRDEARDAEVVSPWREAVSNYAKHDSDCSCAGDEVDHTWDCMDCDCGLRSLLIPSPSPASSGPCESHCQHIESCPARSGRPVCICSGRTSVI